MFRTNHRLIISTYVIFSLGSFWSMIQDEITFWIFLILYRPYCMVLRVVQTQAILFLKSRSERVGSDIERLLNWMMNFSKPLEIDVIHFKSRSMSDPTLSDINFNYKMAWVWTTLNIVSFYLNRISYHTSTTQVPHKYRSKLSSESWLCFFTHPVQPSFFSWQVTRFTDCTINK